MFTNNNNKKKEKEVTAQEETWKEKRKDIFIFCMFLSWICIKKYKDNNFDFASTNVMTCHVNV